ncbi:MAG: hypothetical protein QF415_01135 [Candidatus Undinarchaeales archaeon]|nr:hypothetical protein [Candidatus Undinarchaeales archaeon]
MILSVWPGSSRSLFLEDPLVPLERQHGLHVQLHGDLSGPLVLRGEAAVANLVAVPLDRVPLLGREHLEGDLVESDMTK